MLRIYKHYSFDLRQLRPAANRLSFSSYPGALEAAAFACLCFLLSAAITHFKIFRPTLPRFQIPRPCLILEQMRPVHAFASLCPHPLLPALLLSLHSVHPKQAAHPCCAGELFSDDDFFLTSAGLVILQVPPLCAVVRGRVGL
jgi:hypothetical protein